MTGIYERRFDDADTRAKDAIWVEIAAHLQRYLPAEGIVLDLACDRGYFIRNIRARERWGIDLRDVSGHLPPDVRFVVSDGLAADRVLPAEHFDLVFMSNYLEHLPSSEAVIEQLRVVHRLLRPGGRVMILQPNIRHVGGAYWDFIDHKVPLTAASLEEAAGLAGFRTAVVVSRFLPYTTKSRLPQSPGLVRAYLRLRPLWRLLGKQTLYIGERSASG